jgi:hypothetical protein
MAQWDQVRLLRLQGSENEPSVAVWLALAAPLPLAAMLQSLAGVRDVRETSPDAAPGAERELTITLNEAADGPAKS